MRYSLISVAALFAVASCARVEADSFNCHDAAKKDYDACVAKVKIPKGNECCQPPPCEYGYQLAMYTMLQAMFGSSKLQKQAADGAALEKLVGKLANGKTFKDHLPNCPQHGNFHGNPLDFPPEFETGQESDPTITNPNATKCTIGFSRGSAADEAGSGSGAHFIKTNRDTAGTWFTTCDELIDVNMSHEEHHRETCQGMVDAGAKYDLSDTLEVADEEVEAYQISIDKTTSLLNNWGLGCSTENIKSGAAQRAASGIKALKLGGGKGKK